MVALKKKKKKREEKKKIQSERLMLQETSIILGKNSNPMKKKTVLTIKVCTERKINIQYNTVPADVMHTVQFSFYIWAPA